MVKVAIYRFQLNDENHVYRFKIFTGKGSLLIFT